MSQAARQSFLQLLGDVTLTSPTSGQALTYNGTAWVNGSAGVTDHGALTGLADDDHSQYHNDSRALTWLGTRSTSDVAEGSNLYHTSARVNALIAAAVIDTLSDVTITTPASGQYLKYNGSAWVNSVLAAAGSDTQVQFNNAGAFGGSANLTWSGSALSVNSTITLAGTVGSGGLDFGNSTFLRRTTPIGVGPDVSFVGYDRLIATAGTLRFTGAIEWSSAINWLLASTLIIRGFTAGGNHYFQTDFNNVKWIEYNNGDLALRPYSTTGKKAAISQQFAYANDTVTDLLQLQLASSTTVDTNVAILDPQWADKTHASRKGRLLLKAVDSAGSRECLRIEADGSVGRIGFYGATAVIKQAGTGETTGFTAGAGTNVTDASTFTGNVGSTAYRISDIVKALKNYGLLAA